MVNLTLNGLRESTNQLWVDNVELMCERSRIKELPILKKARGVINDRITELEKEKENAISPNQIEIEL